MEQSTNRDTLAIIGLHRDQVRLEEPDADWSAAYEREKRLILNSASDLAFCIEHVGSTAVAGISAKPIIDIAIALDSSVSFEAMISLLQRCGYTYLQDLGSEGGHFLVKERESDIRTHHVHLIRIRDPQWNNYLRFRDLLRADSTIRDAYVQLKKRLAKKFPSGRAGYTQAKTEFVPRNFSCDGRSGTLISWMVVSGEQTYG